MCWLRSRSATGHPSGSRHGAAPGGEKTPDPLLIRAPENHRCPAKVQVVHGSAGRGGRAFAQAWPTPVGRSPNPIWLDGGGVSVHMTLSLARGGCNLGRECLGGLNQDSVAGRQPQCRTHRGMPDSVHAKARFTSNALPFLVRLLALAPGFALEHVDGRLLALHGQDRALDRQRQVGVGDQLGDRLRGQAPCRVGADRAPAVAREQVLHRQDVRCWTRRWRRRSRSRTARSALG